MTRAKHQLVLWDEGPAAEAFFEHFKCLATLPGPFGGLRLVIGPETDGAKDFLRLRSQEQQSAEAWRAQGDKFFAAQQYQHGLHCYVQAGHRPRADHCRALLAQQEALQLMSQGKDAFAAERWRRAGQLYSSEELGLFREAGRCSLVSERHRSGVASLSDDLPTLSQR